MDAHAIAEKPMMTFSTLEVPSELSPSDYADLGLRKREKRKRLRTVLRKAGVVHPALLAIESTDSKNAVTLDRTTRVELLRAGHRANPLPNHKY